MSTETDRTTLLIEILEEITNLLPPAEVGRTMDLRLKIAKLDELCQPEPVTDDQDLRNPMA